MELFHPVTVNMTILETLKQFAGKFGIGGNSCEGIIQLMGDTCHEPADDRHFRILYWLDLRCNFLRIVLNNTQKSFNFSIFTL